MYGDAFSIVTWRGNRYVPHAVLKPSGLVFDWPFIEV